MSRPVPRASDEQTAEPGQPGDAPTPEAGGEPGNAPTPEGGREPRAARPGTHARLLPADEVHRRVPPAHRARPEPLLRGLRDAPLNRAANLGRGHAGRLQPAHLVGRPGAVARATPWPSRWRSRPIDTRMLLDVELDLVLQTVECLLGGTAARGASRSTPQRDRLGADTAASSTRWSTCWRRPGTT